jgi:hypothetical protein
MEIVLMYSSRMERQKKELTVEGVCIQGNGSKGHVVKDHLVG